MGLPNGAWGVVGVMAATLAACAGAPQPVVREAPMLARPDNVVVHVSPESLATKHEPVSVTCAPSASPDPSPVSDSELRAAIARLPPIEQRIELSKVDALLPIDGRMRIQGRGHAHVNGGTPWNTGIGFAAASSLSPGPGGAPPSLPRQPQIEVGLPTLAAACEDAARIALRTGKPLDVTGIGLFRPGYTGAGAFGLFVLEQVTSCSARP